MTTTRRGPCRTTRVALLALLAVVVAVVPGTPSGATSVDELVEQRRASVAALEVTEAFDLAALPEDPAGTVPLTVVTESGGRRRVRVTHVDDRDAAAAAVAARLRTERVVSVDVDSRVTTGVVVDTYSQWQLAAEQTTFMAAWARTTGSGVKVAVLDTGVQGTHEDLSPRVLQGVEYLTGNGLTTGDNGWNDQNGHGTHVAGIIAATRGNARGVAGMAPDALILPVRVLDGSGSGWNSDVASGIYWAVANGASVINMSLGGPGASTAVRDAIDWAVSQGVVVVASAGNSGAETVNYPGAFANAIGVAASMPGGAVDSYSSYSTSSPYVDITAPGTSILSTYRTAVAPYVYLTGTSMAAPHVAGAAALLLAAAPSATVAQVRNALVSTAQDIESPGADVKSGAGLVDPAAALALLAPPPTTTTAAPPSPGGPATTTTSAAPTTTTTTSAPPAAPALPAGASRFVAMHPTRVLDTRATGAVAPGAVRWLTLAGVAGVDVAATAVVLNVTVTDATGPGFVQVLPAGRAVVGSSSNLNVAAAGETVANQVTVPLGDGGTIGVYLQGGGHVLLDVFGAYVPSGATAAGRFVPAGPARVVDTRSGFGVLATYGTRDGDGFRSGAGGGTTFQVAGVQGVPASGVAAVVLNLTAVDASPGFVQAMPAGAAVAGAYSNLNVSSRSTVANLVVVPVGIGGRVTVHTESSAHLIADVMGYVTSGTAPVSVSGLFVPVAPARVLDTRPTGPLEKQGTHRVQVAGTGAVPGASVAAVLANLTAVEVPAPGYLQVFPTGEAAPGTSSNLNLTAAGQTVPNAVAASLATGGAGAGSVTIYADAGAHVLLDVLGWFTA